MTRKVVNFCLRNGCGKIYIEDLSSLRNKHLKGDNEFKKLMWSPGIFSEMIRPKAAEYGIEVVSVNPANSSIRCGKCDHISKTNRRSRSKFVCDVCGDSKKPLNADYNAAKNIACATEDVIENGYVKTQAVAA